MKALFKDLFNYNHRVNQQLGNILRSNPDISSEKGIKLYSHILNAHQIWNNRINPRETLFGVWEIHSVNDCLEIDRVNYKNVSEIIDTFDLATIIQLQLKGKTFSKSIADVLFHVINHSTYHRGQLATEFRQIGLDPLVTDYFLYSSTSSFARE
jgi:uncharacterized damage-inducible protein DinB